MENEALFTNVSSVQSSRIIYTPSDFARTSLLHLQEIGSLKALRPHASSRENLISCLCFVVLEGWESCYIIRRNTLLLRGMWFLLTATSPIPTGRGRSFGRCNGAIFMARSFLPFIINTWNGAASRCFIRKRYPG